MYMYTLLLDKSASFPPSHMPPSRPFHTLFFSLPPLFPCLILCSLSYDYMIHLMNHRQIFEGFSPHTSLSLYSPFFLHPALPSVLLPFLHRLSFSLQSFHHVWQIEFVSSPHQKGRQSQNIRENDKLHPSTSQCFSFAFVSPNITNHLCFSLSRTYRPPSSPDSTMVACTVYSQLVFSVIYLFFS